MTAIDLVCLANSRKHGGRCVAGWRPDGAGFVRLVSPLADGTLTPIDLRLGGGVDGGAGGGDEPRMFDLLRVGVSAPRPMPHQRENWVIDESPWRLLRRPAPRAMLERLAPWFERGPAILGSKRPAIPYDDCVRSPVAASLAVAKVERTVLVVGERLGRKRLRLRFALRGAAYELTVTDPLWERAVERWECGEYAWWKMFPRGRDPVVTLSLTEPFGDARECFKIVATLWPAPEMRGFRWPKPRVDRRKAGRTVVAARTRRDDSAARPLLVGETASRGRIKPR
ncbi:MAG: hypothetical protein DCC68_03850 [Planctomycetota bacterium]|nr:MAG: hypothetical protein DCC68_03850 [Planctomycetota bacterium]